MKVLVTGGAGFIGSHIADACVAAGYEVVVIDDLSSGKRHQVPPQASFHEVDIRAPEIAAILAAERPEVLIHHAAQMDVRRSVADPRFDAQVNIDGFLNLLEAGRASGLRRVLFASSGGAGYGEQKEFPATENHPLAPMSPYGVAKIASELYLGSYRAIYGLEWVALRYANVYGPRQDPHGEAGVVAIFARKLLAGEIPTINGDGGQTRDYVFVADLVRANLALIRSDYCGALNFGTGIETDVNRLHELLAEACGQGGVAANRGPAMPGEQRRSVISPARAGEVLGWHPEVSLESGIPQTVDFFRS
ncbi:MAG: NAD-dependent epimerase/dehydratase family protein [Deltaproteobacteria bacterium]